MMRISLERVHEYYHRRLMERIYSNWREALARKMSMQQNQHRLAQLQTRIVTRWAFEQWKSCRKISLKSFFFLHGML